MQPMANSVKNLYVYSLNAGHADKTKGNAPPTYTISKNTIRVTIVPTTDSFNMTPYGAVRDMGSIGFVEGHPLKLGDCLGTSTTKLFKVVTLLSFDKPHAQQHAGLKEL